MCEYCEQGKKIKAEDKGEGAATCLSMINSLFGDSDGEYIAYIEDGKMWVDNSSGEYAELGFKINYCPVCGSRNRGDEDDTSSDT